MSIAKAADYTNDSPYVAYFCRTKLLEFNVERTGIATRPLKRIQYGRIECVRPLFLSPSPCL